MLQTRPQTKILVDGGDPAETSEIKALLGYVDGQTTNPTLIAKNPEIRKLLASGRRLSRQEENEEYKKLSGAFPLWSATRAFRLRSSPISKLPRPI